MVPDWLQPPQPMNVFCAILGHTWVPAAENPKTAWNTDGTGLTLKATPSATPRFFEECARCKERRPVAPRLVPGQAAGRKPQA